MNPIRDWLRWLRDEDSRCEAPSLSSSGCVSRLEWILALAGLVMIVAFAIAGYREAVLVTIVIIIVGVVLVVFAGGRSD